MNSRGQSLLELIVVMAVVIVIITALVFSSISSLRNSQLAKNQAQATRLAQEGMETLRILRDRDGVVNKGGSFKFNTDWATLFNCSTDSICYFKITSSGNSLDSTTVSDFETFSQTGDLKNFKRQVRVINGQDAGEKFFTSIVIWTDFAGEKESRQITVLRKL